MGSNILAAWKAAFLLPVLMTSEMLHSCVGAYPLCTLAPPSFDTHLFCETPPDSPTHCRVLVKSSTAAAPVEHVNFSVEDG